MTSLEERKGMTSLDKRDDITEKGKENDVIVHDVTKRGE